MGKPLCSNETTINQTRTGYARICVEISASKTLPTDVLVDVEGADGFTQEVKFEWKPSACHFCSSFSHNDTTCEMAKHNLAEPSRKLLQCKQAANIGASVPMEPSQKTVIFPNHDFGWTEIHWKKWRRKLQDPTGNVEKLAAAKMLTASGAAVTTAIASTYRAPETTEDDVDVAVAVGKPGEDLSQQKGDIVVSESSSAVDVVDELEVSRAKEDGDGDGSLVASDATGLKATPPFGQLLEANNSLPSLGLRLPTNSTCPFGYLPDTLNPSLELANPSTIPTPNSNLFKTHLNQTHSLGPTTESVNPPLVSSNPTTRAQPSILPSKAQSHISPNPIPTQDHLPQTKITSKVQIQTQPTTKPNPLKSLLSTSPNTALNLLLPDDTSGGDLDLTFPQVSSPPRKIWYLSRS